jgi:septal ring factor EnvC (AmiA/AmiB activator)
MKIQFLLLLLALWSAGLGTLYAQKSKQDLESERKSQQKKIGEADYILQKTQHFKQEKLEKLNQINAQIELRNLLVSTVLQEVPLIDLSIAQTDSAMKVNQKQLQKLKDEYAEMLYLSSKTKNSMEKLSFMFSSASFNQLMSRLSYLKQYDEERKKQIKKIQKHQKELASQKKSLENQKMERADLLSLYQNQQRKLDGLRNEQLMVVGSFKNREKELLIEIENRKKAILQLEKAVSEAVGRANRLENNLNIADKATNRTPEPISNASKSFAEAKGKLAWPVQEGKVVGKFGKQKHPILENITIDNLGVDISTKQGENVRTIYDGVVIAVSKVMGNYYMVLVQHSDYFTVYAQLQSVKIKIGEKIKAKDLIGSVGTNSEGVALLQFQIWQNKKRLNPEEWLAKSK